MNNLTILILIVVGVVVAYLLEEWSEQSDTKIFIQQNWFGSAPEGSWTDIYRADLAAYVFLFTGVGIIWILINIPKLQMVATAYLFFAIIHLISSNRETFHPENPTFSHFCFMSHRLREVGVLKAILAGALTGLGFFTVISSVGLMAMPTPMTVLPLVQALIVFGLIAPFAEEGLFRAILFPTIGEDFGIIPAILIVSFLFAIFHFHAYGGGIIMLLIAFSFGTPLALLALWSQAALPAFVAHAVFNILVVLSSMGV